VIRRFIKVTAVLILVLVPLATIASGRYLPSAHKASVHASFASIATATGDVWERLSPTSKEWLSRQRWRLGGYEVENVDLDTGCGLSM
jgi:hypothetical protein